MTSRMHPYQEVWEEFASTVNLRVELHAQVVHLAVQLVAPIVRSVDQEWFVDQVDMEASMGAASTHIAKVRDKFNEHRGGIRECLISLRLGTFPIF